MFDCKTRSLSPVLFFTPVSLIQSRDNATCGERFLEKDTELFLSDDVGSGRRADNVDGGKGVDEAEGRSEIIGVFFAGYFSMFH